MFFSTDLDLVDQCIHASDYIDGKSERCSSLCSYDVTLASHLIYSVFAEVRAGFLRSIWV